MTLTKQFWDSLEKSCPKEVKAFKAWLTEYAEEIDWHTLFDDPFTPFHDLPDAMQFGIFVQYVNENYNQKVLSVSDGFAEYIERRMKWIKEMNDLETE